MASSKFLISVAVNYESPYTSLLNTYVTSDVEFSDVRLPAKAFQGGIPAHAFMISIKDVGLSNLEIMNENPASQFAKYPGSCSNAGTTDELICTVIMFPFSNASDCDSRNYLPDDWVIKNGSYLISATYKNNTKRTIRLGFVDGCELVTGQRFSGDRKPQYL